MKIDKRNPAHWLYLALFLLNVTLALVPRLFRRRRATRRVILYGHKLGGNLLAIYRQLHEARNADFEVAFLTMDPAYHRELSERGESCLLATSPRCIAWLATADAVISDHGLHALLPMLYLSDMKFFDVWHGIPFKGFDADDFRVQHRYDEIWVASPLLKSLYVERFGFSPERVLATGNPRTDLIVGKENERKIARAAFGLPHAGRLVLFAPTWKQDAKNRALFPFGTTQVEFMSLLASVASRHGATVALRMHLNSGASEVEPVAGVVQLPFARFPDTELLLVATDLLVCDWSSLAFDFLVLQRPAIFLDVEPPFRKGFSLDASYRYGATVSELGALEIALDRYLRDPGAYARDHGAYANSIHDRVYGGSDDGNATIRCMERLRLALH